MVRQPPMKAHGMSEAARKAELLFETSTVAEIREVETKANAEIEEKKVAMRQLVGDSYRDLISSADTILAMANTCTAVVDNITTIQGRLAGLTERLAPKEGAAAAEPMPGASKREQLHAVGGRIKYLVDTPETLWGCLDAGAFLQAAHRFLRASVVHEALDSREAAAAMRQFPLVRTQWPLVAKFRGQILGEAKQQLAGAAGLAAPAAADALAAAAFLEQSTSQQALELFLASRLTFLQTKLAADGNSSGGSSTLAALLAELAALVQDTICQVGELFLEPLADMAGSPPLLPTCAAPPADLADAAAELLFGPLTAGSSATPEADKWQELTELAATALAPLPSSGAAAAASQWLADAAAAVNDAAPQLLASAASAQDLAAAEAAARAAIAGWDSSGRPADVKPGRQPLQQIQLPQQTPQHSSQPEAAQHSGKQKELLRDWAAVSEWVLGRRQDVWQAVFDATFLRRGKALIAAAFAQVVDGLDAPLAAAAEAAAQLPAAPPGAFCSEMWHAASAGRSSVEPATKRARLADAAAPQQPTEQRQLEGWRPRVEGMRAAFDAGVRGALAGALLLLQPATSTAVTAQLPALSRRAGSGRLPASPRAAELEPYVQERCLAAGQAVAAKLADRLGALLPASASSAAAVAEPGATGAAVAEGALLLARLATALGTDTPALQVVLGPPAGWRTDASPRTWAAAPVAATSRSQARGQSQLDEVQAAIRAVAASAFAVWASWAGRSLATELVSGLGADAALTSAVPLRGWQETVVAGEEGGNMRFWLPGGPSPAVLAALMSACRELDRAGGHRPSTPALELLEWELASAAIATLAPALEDRAEASTAAVQGGPQKTLGGRLSERGVLQLLFDLQLLRTALEGGRPASAGKDAAAQLRPGTLPPDVSARRRQWAELEGGLQSRLDPIDWATYEPYLAANVADFLQRAGVLLGSLLQLARPPASEGGQKPGTPASNANIVAMAPPAERFAYLPISTPSAAAAAMRRAAAPSLIPTAAGRGGADEDDESYSFADLGGRSAGFATTPAAAATAEGSAFEALQNSAGARLGAFSSLLGDKAAEAAGTLASAASLGDYLQPSAASSLLSSFRSRWQT